MKRPSRSGWLVLFVALTACSTVVTATEPVSSGDVAAVDASTSTGLPPTTESSPPAEPSTTEPSATAPTTTLLASTTDIVTTLADPSLANEQFVPLRFESRVDDVSSAALAAEALAILNDPRGWANAGFTFVDDETAAFAVVLAEGPVVDELCLPLVTYGRVSCQNGPVVALNADRWRNAVPHWDGEVTGYRGYLVNHEVGHLIGQRHPTPRCPVAGRPAGVMEQQTAGLEGCTGNAWPRDWEIAHASVRPVVYAPLPDWGPDPVPANGES